jgi:hypothetical protein
MAKETLTIWVRAAALACALAMVLPGPASAKKLEMFIKNQSSVDIFFDTQTGIVSYPNTIEAQTTSEPIEAAETRDPTKGQITYMNNANSAEATCTVALSYSYWYNSGSQHCDDKGFTTTNTGQCQLKWVPDCYGAGSCKCNFLFTTD